MSGNPRLSAAKKSIVTGLTIAAVQVGGALLLTLARKQGMIDADTATRGGMVLIGLGVAAYGNTMPKIGDDAPPPSLRTAVVKQAVSRVGGWTMVLFGLAYAGLWAFAPRDVASVGCLVAVGVAAVILLVYAAWGFVAYRRTSASHGAT